MRITSFQATNWLIHPHLRVDLTPLTLICGPNDVGKTSMADGIAFALLAETRRAVAKSERKTLIREGQSAGSVSVTAGHDWHIKREIGTGKMTSGGTHPMTADAITDALPYLLAPERIAAAEPDARRVLIMRCLGAAIDASAILRTLTEREYPADLVAQLPATADLEDWRKRCGDEATQARGAWRQITGETYGSVKADTWTAPEAEPVTEADLAAALDQLDAASATWGAATRALESHDAAARTAAAVAAQPAEATAQAAVDAAQAKRDRCAADLPAAQALVARAGSTELHCPDCGSVLELRDGALVHSQEAPDEEDLAQARATIAAHTAAQAALAEAERGLARARAVADARRTVGAPEPFDPAARPALAEAVATADAEVKRLRTAREGLLDRKRRAEGAAKLTEEAAAAHRRVQGWMKIGVALEPNGIPGELMTKAIAPMNATLRQLATETGWRQVTIGPDMEVRADGRPYILLGVSARWRTDAMLAVALAIHSKVKLVVLDGFDVLQVPDRGPALGWLHGLASNGVLDTAIVIATLKAKPPAPSDVRVVWLGPDEEERRAA